MLVSPNNIITLNRIKEYNEDLMKYMQNNRSNMDLMKPFSGLINVINSANAETDICKLSAAH